jgi:uncharacterized membrane protein
MMHDRATPERLNAFCDAIFAVLITVLVLELRPPEIPTFRALAHPRLGLGICCACLIGYLRQEPPGAR